VFDFVAAAFQVPRSWSDKNYISPEQLLEDRLQDVEDQELSVLTSEHQFSFHVAFLPNWDSNLRPSHQRL
jgi:hypothetical protein